MAPRRIIKPILLISFVLISAVLVVSSIKIDREFSGPGLKEKIEKTASDFFRRPLTIGQLEWHSWPHWVLVGKDVRLWEDSSKNRFIGDSPTVEVRLGLLSLSKLALHVSSMKLIRPKIVLRRDERGIWNIHRLVDDIDREPAPSEPSDVRLVFDRFILEEGSLTVERADGSPSLEPPLSVAGHGRIKFWQRNPEFEFELSALAAPPSEKTQGAQFFDAKTSLTVSGHFISTSSSSYSGAVQSSNTLVEFQCAVRPHSIDLVFTSPRSDLLELGTWVRVATAVGLPQKQDTPENSGGPNLTARRDTVRLSATIDAQNAHYQSTPIERFHAVLRHETEVTVIDPLEFQSLGGSGTVRATYDPASSTDSLRVDWTSAGIQAPDLLQLVGSEAHVNGIIGSTGHLETGVGPGFLPHMNGTVKFEIKNGELENMPGLLKVFSKLNLTTLITAVKGGDRSSQIPFDNMRGTVNIMNGRASTAEPLVLENSTMRMAFMGTDDLTDATIDGKLVINILMVTDEVLAKIPIVRDILLSEDKSFIPVWMSLKGKTADPEIKIMPFRSIASPIWNTVGNILGLPSKLFNELTGKKKDPH